MVLLLLGGLLFLLALAGLAVLLLLAVLWVLWLPVRLLLRRGRRGR